MCNDIQSILARTQELGMRIWVQGDRLAINPAKQCPADLESAIREHKPVLMEYFGQCRDLTSAKVVENLAAGVLRRCRLPGRVRAGNDIVEASQPRLNAGANADSHAIRRHGRCRLGKPYKGVSGVKYYAVEEFPVSMITSCEEVPNFKTDADLTTGLVPGHELGGKYDPLGTGRVVVWLRSSGKYELITGRHRYFLARSTGEKTIPVQIVREDDGFTLAEAITLDAQSNIRDGQGTVEDYAHYFKNSRGLTEADATSKGLLSRAKGRDGWDLGKNASEDLYSMWWDDKISTEKAVAIAQSAPDNHELQGLGIKQASKYQSASDLKNFIHAVKVVARRSEVKQVDLFGRDDSAMKLAEAMGTQASKHQRELAERIRTVRGAAKRPELAAQEGVDVRNPEELRIRIGQMNGELEQWQNWWMRPELVAKIKAEIEAE